VISIERGLDLEISYAIVDGVSVQESSKELKNFLRERIGAVSSSHVLETLKDEPIIRSYRDFFWRIGIDPTKIRPSSEALVRRVLQGKELPRINNVVDCYNLVSMETLIAMGAYDLGRVSGSIELVRSTGEEFLGIGGKVLTTDNQIVLRDRERIIAVYPYRDSEHTKITPDTKSLVVVACGVPGIEKQPLDGAAKLAFDYMERFCKV